MLFSQVIGQQEIKAKLRNLVEHNRLSHALLLNAPEGCRRTAIGIGIFTIYGLRTRFK